MTAILVIAVFLAALAACGFGFYLSCRLMFRGFRRIFAPNFGPPAGARQDGPEMPATPVPDPVRPEVPGWSAKLVSDHIAHCQRCREDYVAYTLPLLEQPTISRILAVIEDHEPVTP